MNYTHFSKHQRQHLKQAMTNFAVEFSSIPLAVLAKYSNIILIVLIIAIKREPKATVPICFLQRIPIEFIKWCLLPVSSP